VSGFAGSLAIFLVLWIALSLLGSLLWRSARRPLVMALNALRATSRANTLRLIALLPLLASLFLSAGLFEFPGWLIAPHCHPLQCAAHSPAIALAAWVWMLPAIAVLATALVLTATIRRTLRVARQWRQLSEAGAHYRILPTLMPMACAIGFLRPTIYLSRGLLDGLSPAAIAVITAHEQAHVKRADNFWLTVIRIGCLFWIGRDQLIDDIELAHDQACDRAAANDLGDALLVADTLVRCRQLANPPALATTSNFLRGHIAARVQAVLCDHEQPLASVRKMFLTCLLILAGAAAVPLLHYLLEQALII
jgi:Zn-dependent protease with chaperone function